MPLPGRMPKPRDQVVHRNPVAEWYEVPNTPYSGKIPVTLPKIKRVMAKDGPYDVKLMPATKDWWDTLCRMPHCVLWEESDWQFALVSAIIADGAFSGSAAAATELRAREKVMGTTHDFRRALRIRYVDPKTGKETQEAAERPGNVMDIESYRDL